MGHPKALTLLPDGRRALERVVATCEEAGVPMPLVVLGEHHDEVRAALPHLDGRVHWLRNPRPGAGRTGSLQRGLAAASAPVVLVLPIDHPLVAADTLRRLLATPGAWVVPEREGRGGHPLKLADVALAAVQSAPPATPLRDVPAMMGLEVARVAVDDPGIHQNLDTPADVASLRGGEGSPVTRGERERSSSPDR
jgi:molybdenum cofactor cytidylyltransferase